MLQREARANQVGGRTSAKKLNGIVYTPPDLARAMVARLPLEAAATWLDPACGAGVFLVAALERAAAAGVALRLEGWDVDPDALAAAEAELREAAARLGVPSCWQLRHRDALVPESRRFDVVVGNPPYLEAKRMPDALKARVKAACPVSATGAFDLYAAFVEVAARLLHDRGAMSFLVPNRLAVTANADGLRRWMLTLGEVTAIDLSRSTPFPDAAVYPMVVELRRDRPPGLAGPARAHGGRWPLPTSPEAAALLGRVLREVPSSVGDRFEVRWTVSFHAAGLRDRYVTERRPDSPHARPFVGGGRFSGNREVQPFRLSWGGWWIDYDEARARSDRNPLPPLALFERPKVAVCQNARRCRAAVDLDGHVLKDTFLAATLRPGVPATWLHWLPVVLHSRVFHVCYDALNGGTRKGGGFLHFLGSYLEPFPLPPPPPGVDPEEVYRRGGDEAVVEAAFGVSADEAHWLGAIELPGF